MRLTKTPESRLPAVPQTQPPVSPITPHGYISLIGPAPSRRAIQVRLPRFSIWSRTLLPPNSTSTAWPYSFPSLVSSLFLNVLYVYVRVAVSSLVSSFCLIIVPSIMLSIPITLRITTIVRVSLPRSFARLPVLSGICKCVLFGGTHCLHLHGNALSTSLPCYVPGLDFHSGVVLIHTVIPSYLSMHDRDIHSSYPKANSRMRDCTVAILVSGYGKTN